MTQAGALILWFDDLHWADEASLELLHYVARHTAAHPLLIIGVYRPDAAVDNPYLDQIKGSQRVTVVELASLDKKTVDQMLLRRLDDCLPIITHVNHIGTTVTAYLPTANVDYRHTQIGGFTNPDTRVAHKTLGTDKQV